MASAKLPLYTGNIPATLGAVGVAGVVRISPPFCVPAGAARTVLGASGCTRTTSGNDRVNSSLNAKFPSTLFAHMYDSED